MDAWRTSCGRAQHHGIDRLRPSLPSATTGMDLPEQLSRFEALWNSNRAPNAIERADILATIQACRAVYEARRNMLCGLDDETRVESRTCCAHLRVQTTRAITAGNDNLRMLYGRGTFGYQPSAPSIAAARSLILSCVHCRGCYCP